MAIYPACLLFAMLLEPAMGVLSCTSHQIQAFIGQYSAVCSSLFSDTLTLSSELNDGLYLLNHTATMLQTLVAKVR